MTKQEVKEEHKQTEGSPEVKRRQRQIRYDRAQQNISQAVPKADVIITNPQHFAIALKYESNMPAPMVVAKGLDLIALGIRKIGEDNDVPIIENPPLARALFKDVNVNEYITIDHYEAVAKIISYVFGLKASKKSTKN
jgi:flagellar biosynthetic protein FlhB